MNESGEITEANEAAQNGPLPNDEKDSMQQTERAASADKGPARSRSPIPKKSRSRYVCWNVQLYLFNGDCFAFLGLEVALVRVHIVRRRRNANIENVRPVDLDLDPVQVPDPDPDPDPGLVLARSLAAIVDRIEGMLCQCCCLSIP